MSSNKKASSSKPQENKDKTYIVNKFLKFLDFIRSPNLNTLPRNLNFFFNQAWQKVSIVNYIEAYGEKLKLSKQ